ncbi:MAG: hypothetical protein DCC68_21610 [Planctomycetota bacterium]|nr:MAG: hypothetical protein DCC68_21610 [Planctomycetota bacterium]
MFGDAPADNCDPSKTKGGIMRHTVLGAMALSVFVTWGVVRSARRDEGFSLASQPANTWVKRTPLEGTPISPRMGYEGACVWDARHRLLVRYGGHNQGGGGEQGAEVWTFDPKSAVWSLKEPNLSPPGVCCNQQNIYDAGTGLYVRFPNFSGNHGWQWQRELYLNDISVWTYDLAANRWKKMTPLPAPPLAGLRCASWDSDRQVIVVFGGEGSREGTLIYDPRRNEWHRPKPAKEPEPRSGGNMAYDAARKLHILFGAQFSDDPHTWAYDVAKNEWRDMQPPSMPPTNKNDAVLTYDSVNKVVLAIVKIDKGGDDDEEKGGNEIQTWAYDAGANRWTRMNPKTEPDAGGNRTRNLVFAPELNLAILENCTSKPREQQVWTYRYADAEPSDAVPKTDSSASAARVVTDVVASVLANNRVEVAWTPPANAKPARYLVERAAVEVWSEDQLARLKQNTPPLAEPSVGAIRRVGPFVEVGKLGAAETAFIDTAIDLAKPQKLDGEPIYDRDLHREHLDSSGKPYGRAVFAYRVRMIDESGETGGPSPATFTIPPSPEMLFSREDGETCRLKWAASSNKGIAGYRVYRLDGRWDKDPVSRLTAEPVKDTTFADETAGKHTRRYYIVAVDTLGQEGFPSSPVWYQREWREFYEPFVGEWHQ